MPAAAARIDRDATWMIRDAAKRAATCASAEAAAEQLLPLFADIAWLEALVRDWTGPMRDDPVAMPPFSATRGGSGASLVLASAPGVTLLVTRISGAAERPEPDGQATSAPILRFSGQLCLVRLLGHRPARGRLAWRAADQHRCRSRAITIPCAVPLRLDECRRALWITPDEHARFLLRARIARTPAPAERRHDLATGTLIETVHGDQELARSAMLLAYLRAAGHRAAVPTALDLLARTEGRARWAVMRELLALDATAAWPHLEAMAARDPEPAVRAAARQTIDRHAVPGAAAPCLA